MKYVVAVLAWIFLYTVAIPSCGKKIDRVCVKGKVAREQVISTQGHPGSVLAEFGDRIVLRECSEIMRKLTFRNQYEAVLGYFKS